MPVSIRFRGPMMFVVHDEQVNVLIPQSQSGGLHPDRSKAVPHYAWLAAWSKARRNPADFLLREKLSAVSLTIDDGAPSTAWDDETEVFDLTDIVQRIGMPEGGVFTNRGIAAEVILKGGSIRGSLWSQDGWEWIDVTKRADDGRPTRRIFEGPAVELTWTASGPVTVRLQRQEGGPGKLVIPDDDENVTIQVGNLDQTGPEAWPEDVPVMAPADRPQIDHDFKWIYAMFGHVDWTKALHDPKTGKLLGLPAPKDIDDTAGITGSCNSAVVFRRTRR